jgi:hypothetical protein
LGHRIPRISPERAAVRMQSSSASTEEAFRVRSLAMKTATSSIWHRGMMAPRELRRSRQQMVQMSAPACGVLAPSKPLALAASKTFSIGPRTARRFQPSLSKSALGLPARHRWRWCPRAWHAMEQRRSPVSISTGPCASHFGIRRKACPARHRPSRQGWGCRRPASARQSG